MQILWDFCSEVEKKISGRGPANSALDSSATINGYGS